MSRSFQWKAGAALVLAGILLALAVSGHAAEPPALILVGQDGGSGFPEAIQALKQSGVRPLHLFPPDALIAEFPESAEGAVQSPGLTVFRTPVEGWDMSVLGKNQALAAEAWNVVFHGRGLQTPAEPAEPAEDDALEIPASRGEAGLACTADAPSRMLSEYLLGSITINVILPESTGAVDASTENWDESREAQALAGVVAGAQWLLARAPIQSGALALSFTYHLYSGRTDARAAVSYEPISRAADPTHEPGSGEGLWTNQIYNAFGYSAHTDRWAKARAFGHASRMADGTNWAATVFVVDSLSDPDGRFTDNRFAYTWQPGSHFVMTYDNSGWGIARMGSVFAHELCHAFWAKDEYSGSGCSCAQSSGYLNGTNGNCAATCSASEASCVMRSADLSNGTGSVCPFTAKQLGWLDADSDGIPDSVDAPPALSLDSLSEQEDGFTLTGSAQVQSVPNHNPSSQAYLCSLTPALLAFVHVRLNGGAWADAVLASGFESGSPGAFTHTVSGLAPGVYDVDVRVVDTLGQETIASTTYTRTGSGPASPPPVPDGLAPGSQPMAVSAAQDDTLLLSWDAACAAAATNLYWGYGSGLPAALGGAYALSGSACGVGTGGSGAWAGSPDPSSDASRVVWFILVNTDGAATEGSWGKDSAAQERNGAQASGQCGITVKDLTNPGC